MYGKPLIVANFRGIGWPAYSVEMKHKIRRIMMIDELTILVYTAVVNFVNYV